MTGASTLRNWGAAALLAALLPLAVQAQQVRAYRSADSVSVGERFFLSITAEHPQDLRPVFPSDSAFGDIEVFRRIAHDPRPTRSGARVDSVVYEVATFALDSAAVPPLTVAFVYEGDTTISHTEPLWVRVRSVVPPEGGELRDFKPIVGFPRPVWPLVAGALALIAVAAALLAVLRRKRPAPPVPPPAPEPVLPPYEQALQRLGHLEAAPPREGGDFKPWFVDLSDTLRTYLEARAGVPARERTTAEVGAALERPVRRGMLPAEGVERLRAALEAADLVKFASHRPDAASIERTLRLAYEALHTLEAAHRRAEATPPHPDRQP